MDAWRHSIRSARQVLSLERVELGGEFGVDSLCEDDSRQAEIPWWPNLGGCRLRTTSQASALRSGGHSALSERSLGHRGRPAPDAERC